MKEKHGKEITETFGVEVVSPSLAFPQSNHGKRRRKSLADQGYIPPDETKKGDIDPQGERLLCEYARKNMVMNSFLLQIIPMDVRPFYHMGKEDNPRKTKSFDLLWKWMEITTGAQREHRYDVLVEQAKEKGVDQESIQFYLDFFRFGCPPHGGFGFGLATVIGGHAQSKEYYEMWFSSIEAQIA